MTCSRSSSSSAPAALLVVAVLAGFPGQALPAPDPDPEGAQSRARIALLPPENLSERGISGRRVAEAFEAALARAGLEVVSGDVVERFLVANRIRYTGGVNQSMATAAREGLGVQGILVTSVLEYRAGPPPRVAVVARLVSTEDEPVILWIDGANMAGDQDPGWLSLGIVTDLPEVERRVMDELAGSLGAFVTGEGPGGRRCPSASRFKPRVAFRSAMLEAGAQKTVAVLPFGDKSRRSRAGLAMQLELLRQVFALNQFRIVEPGVVRDTLLRNRVVLEPGVAMSDALALRLDLDVDVIFTGEVFDLDEATVPKVNVSVAALDGRVGEVVWMSNSYNQGSDGVVFFDIGRVATASELSCRMLGMVAEGISGNIRSRPRPKKQTFDEWHRGAFGPPQPPPAP